LIEKNNLRLSGLKEISAYAGREWPTVLQWINKNDFPAEKIGGRWESFKHLIDGWFLMKIRKGRDYGSQSFNPCQI
jgi:predicted DNA-binding transcriptional regulator AlpA